MTVKINGYDITPYIEFDSFEWTRSKVENKLTTLNGVDHYSFVREKVGFKAGLYPVPYNIACAIFGNISSTESTVSATVTDLQNGIDYTFTGHARDKSAKMAITYKGGTSYWKGITLEVEEC